MRILIVDDDYVSRAKLTALLSTYGQCDAVPNGQIGLQMFQEAHKELVPYDLVTMDYEMPDLSGEAVVGQIREMERMMQVDGAKEAKILMVTVKKGMKEVSASYSKGCTGYITKPVTPENLIAALAEIGFKE
ncbi:MAG: response regulator [Candidatus Omnitrophica bacterium]|nr:response regulator [Candidatus Omnitrophota bacterium]